MKMNFLIFTILLGSGFVLCFTSCENKSSTNTNSAREHQIQDTTQLTKVDSNNNSYLDLRSLAFSMTPEQIGVPIHDGQTKIYAVIMDWALGEGTVTLVAFLSGDASLYLSSGGGVIGGVGHDNIKQAAVAFINKAEKYLSKTVKTANTPLPEKDGVKFYFLTNNGTFIGEEHVQNFDNSSSQWLDLFEEGNKLITEIRTTTD
jgi:hypothetical protein